MIEPIKRTDDSIEILDQRALPERTTYLICKRGMDVVEAIQTLAVRGAPAIALAGLYALWLEARALAGTRTFERDLVDAKESIKNARPTAVNLAWAVDRTWNQRPLSAPVADLVHYLRASADTLWQEEWARSERMAQFGLALLMPASHVLTHCNTGSLATAGVGTALGVIRRGAAEGLIDHVFVDETRPLLQGARLTAWELQQEHIPATLITDNTAAFLMAQHRVDAIFVGADRITANGDTANKIGTYGLAVLAHYHHVPFYVVAPLSTVDLGRHHGDEIPIEERHPDEVRQIQGRLVAPPEVGVYNPAFDVTPAPLITAIVTDAGIVRPPYRKSLAQLFSDRKDVAH